ncbi:CU044_5270 family protein [Nonomuraea sp. CA-143628]|uniref:CU044_5270 family protein n=1 Tax=Nonomuraea sp. CA-143628 TaxID=3239997 RepID=UPI003D8DE08D
MSSRDEIAVFREGRPEVPSYDPMARERLHARLFDQPVDTRAGARRGWFVVVRVMGVGAAAAALVAGIVVLKETPGARQGRVTATANGGTPTVVRLRPVADAQDLAGNAAAKAAADDEPAPRPDQWAYVKTVVAQTKVDGGPPLFGQPKVTRTHEMWRRVNEKGFATIENGRLKTYDGSEFEVTYPYLLGLPTDPDRLLARMYGQVEREHDARPVSRDSTASPPPMSEEERDTVAFQQLAQGMRDAALPARLRAAMYGAMAKIPGVKYRASAADLAGRPGVTLYRLQYGYQRDEIFIDPKTYEYMGYRTIVVRDHDGGAFDSVKKGQVLGWDSVLKATLVDKAGQRP